MAVKAIIMSYTTIPTEVTFDTWIVNHIWIEFQPVNNHAQVCYKIGLYKSKASYNNGHNPVEERIKMYNLDLTTIKATYIAKDDWYIPMIQSTPAVGESVSDFTTGTIS